MPTDTGCDRLDFSCNLPAEPGLGDYVGGAFSWWNELTWGTAGEVISGIASGPLKWLAEEVFQAVDEVLIALTTWWIGVPTPTGSAWQNSAGVVQTYTSWLVLILAIVSILIAGMQMIIQSRGEPLARLVRSLLTMIVVSGAGVYLAGLFVQIMDGTASWIIDETIDTSDGNFFIAISGFASLGGGFTAILVIFFGLLQMILGVVQVVLMMLRTTLLLLLAGTMPLAFSMTNTSWGSEWAQKTVGWFLAFALYKPAAALVYATGITITSLALPAAGDDFGSGLLMLSTGLMIMATATLTLPALMRLILPAVGSMAAGSGSAVIAGGIGAAIGAKQIAGMGAGGSGPSSAGAPTGATPAGGEATSAATGAAAGAATGGLAQAGQQVAEKAKEGVENMDAAVTATAADPTTDGGPGGANTPGSGGINDNLQAAQAATSQQADGPGGANAPNTGPGGAATVSSVGPGGAAPSDGQSRTAPSQTMPNSDSSGPTGSEGVRQ